MEFNDLKLRCKLIVIITAVSALVLILSGTVFGFYEIFKFKHETVQTSGTTAEILGSQCVAPILFNDEQAAADTLAALASDKNVITGAVFLRDLSVFAIYNKNGVDVKAVDMDSRSGNGHHFDDHQLELWRVIRADGENIGYIYLCVDLKWHKIKMLQYTGMAGGVFFLMVLISIGISFLVQRIFTRPVERIIKVSEAIAKGEQDYSARVPGEELKDELGVLATSFNSMLSRIEKSDRDLQAARDDLEERVIERTQELVVEIKHRRQTEAELRQERDMAQRYMDMAGVMLLALDKDGYVTMCNRKGAEITGYSESELIGENWFTHTMTSDGREQRRKLYIDSLLGRTPWMKYDENPIITKSGEKRMISWHNTPLKNDKGEVIGSLSSGLDITEKEKAESEIRRAQKLESIGTFAGGIAHDFNNFLMVIQGNIELAQMSLDNPSKISDLLEEAVAGAGRARGLTQQLITFSKGGEPRKNVFKLTDLVQETVGFVLTGSNVTLNINIDNALWSCNADAGQIEQVVANLAVNAKQAMPEGGVLHISVDNLSAEEAEKKGFDAVDYIEMTVRDEGCGIPKDVIPKIFDPYFTTKSKGSGLGLAISYSIIKRHEGHINVESEQGKGTSFRILLPAVIEKVVKNIPKPKTAKLARSYKILLMEDEPMVGDVIKIMLEMQKCRASVALDGVEAIEMYKTARGTDDPYDAVILDIIVPNGMGGKEASCKLLELDPDAKLIISSAYSDDPLMAKYAENGFMGCIAKPYTCSELEVVLKSVLEPDESSLQSV